MHSQPDHKIDVLIFEPFPNFFQIVSASCILFIIIVTNVVNSHLVMLETERLNVVAVIWKRGR